MDLPRYLTADMERAGMSAPPWLSRSQVHQIWELFVAAYRPGPCGCNACASRQHVSGDPNAKSDYCEAGRP